MSREEREPLFGTTDLLHDSNDECRITRRKVFPVLESAVLLLLFGLNLSGTVFQNHVVYQVCTVVYKYSEDDCSRLGTDKGTNESRKIEAEVQPYASKIFMIQIILENVVPALGSFIIGPWSDKKGRKPVLVAAFIGFSTKYVFFALIAFLSTKALINPWFYISAIVPEIILGGNNSFSIGCIGYIRDVTNEMDRPFRMVVYQSCIYTGLLTGSLCSSYILHATNTIIVLTITASIVVFLTLCILIFLHESLEMDEESAQTRLCDTFQYSFIEDSLKTCFKRRPIYDRTIIFLVLGTIGLYNLVLRGNGTVFYLFTRKKFAWTVKDYTIFETASIATQTLGNVLGMIFLRKILGLSATTLALLAYSSATLDTVTLAVATRSWHIYLSIGLGVLRGIGAPMCFTILTNIVPANETGKIFSLTNALQSFLLLLSSPLYTFVYNKTLTVYPGAFHFISTGLLFICFIHISIINTIKTLFPSAYTAF